jgi:hypothetical protein
VLDCLLPISPHLQEGLAFAEAMEVANQCTVAGAQLCQGGGRLSVVDVVILWPILLILACVMGGVGLQF